MRGFFRLAILGGVVAALALATLPAGAQSTSKAPAATEIGVTPKEIHIAVVADVDTPFAPGLFQGVVTGVQGAAKYLNSKEGGGGLAGRKLVVDFIDSHLNANEARNAIITACQNDLALVGTSALFLTSVDDEVGCKDRAGEPVGLPDLDGIVTSVQHACAATSFPIIGTALECATKDQDPQTYFGSVGEYKYLLGKSKAPLHGPMLVSNDTKDANRAGTVIALAAQRAGIEPDQGTTVERSSRDVQSAYTSIVQQMKDDHSNYALITLAASSAVAFRNEAQLQGLDGPSVVWDCISCYDNPDVSANAATMEGTWAAIGFLPFNETKSNKMLAAFVANVGEAKADSFSAYGWTATMAFGAAIKAAVARGGVNGITRQSTLDGIKSLTHFDAGGMVGEHNFNTRTLTPCYVLTQFRNGRWVRVHPAKAGTFDCKPSNKVTMKANLTGG